MSQIITSKKKMKSLNKIEIPSDRLFWGLTDYQKQVGRRMRNMYKALRNLDFTHEAAVEKILKDTVFIYEDSVEITQDLIKEVLKK